MHKNCVVTLPAPGSRPGHEQIARAAMARQLATLLGYDFGGDYDPDQHRSGHIYFVPQHTLLREQSEQLGIRNEGDLYGGVVPDYFVATKAITHAAVDLDAHVPEAWSHHLAEHLRGVVLPGYSAFSVADLRRAALSLLHQGRVRIKGARGIGGGGQWVVGHETDLDEGIEKLDAGELHEHGAVVEQNYELAQTYSIGEVSAAGLRIAYYGLQSVTRNHHGHDVYGGSDLHIVRGELADLLRLDVPVNVKVAIRQAATYDAAVGKAFPQFFASRRNYDVLQGLDRNGHFVSGVLEQSWRIGGASPAEIAAIEAFKSDPGMHRAHASIREIYSAAAPVPPHAHVLYHGVDEQVGWLLKYSVIEPEDESA
jgi:hypothetical protein